MEQKFKQLAALFARYRVKLNEPLRLYTFSKFGGTAEAFFIATTVRELVDIVSAAQDLKIPFQVFGAGTKVFFSGRRVHGLVIKNRTGEIKIGGVKGKVGQNGIGVEEALIEADSGVSLGRFNQFLADQKLPMINFVSSANATIGGSLLIESPVHPVVQIVRVLEKGEIVEIEVSDLKRNQIILSVVFKIKA